MIDAAYLFWFFSVLLAGFNIIVLLDRAWIIKGVEAVALAFPLGLGAIALELFIIGTLGLNFNVHMVMLPWYLLTLPCLAFIKGRIGERFLKAPGAFGRFDKVLLGLLSFETAYTFFRAVIKPMETYDSVAIYGLKSKILYLAGKVPEGYYKFIVDKFHGVHPDYPPLGVFSETWFYIFTGSFNDFWVKAIFPIFFVSFAGIFYSILKRLLNNKTTALFFTFILCSVSQFNTHATMGYMDIMVSVFFSLGLLYLIQWSLNNSPAFLALSFIFTVFGVFTKNEGTALAAINLCVMALILFKQKKNLLYKDKLSGLIYIFFIVTVVALFKIYNYFTGLFNDNFTVSMLSGSNIIPAIKRIPLIFYEYQKNFLGFKKWNIVWVWLFALLVYRKGNAFKGTCGYAGAGFIFFLMFYSVVYMFTTVDVKYMLTVTGSRFFVHILPAAVFWMACMSSDFKIENILGNERP